MSETKTTKPNEHPDFITVYRPICGWKAIHYWWNDENKHLGGFWEPWQTGPMPHSTKASAELEAKAWAEAEEMEYKPNTHDPEEDLSRRKRC